jgi:hypothetical protein
LDRQAFSHFSAVPILVLICFLSTEEISAHEIHDVCETWFSEDTVLVDDNPEQLEMMICRIPRESAV